MPFWRPRGCVLWLDFLEPSGSVAYDKSGYGNHGTIHGAQRVRSLGRWGLEFDGVDDYVETPVVSVTNKFTIEALVLYEEGQPEGNYAGIVCNLNGCSDTNRFLVRADVVLLQLQISGETYNHFCYNIPQLQNVWRHYVATYDGAAVRIFIDGEKRYEKAQTGVLDSGTRPLYVGWGSTNPSYYHLRGVIAFVRIYNRALTSREIKANCAYFFSHLKGEV